MRCCFKNMHARFIRFSNQNSYTFQISGSNFKSNFKCNGLITVIRLFPINKCVKFSDIQSYLALNYQILSDLAK